MALDEQLVCPHCASTIAFNASRDWITNPRITRWADHKRLMRVGAFAVYYRDSTVAQMVHRLKYNGQYDLGQWMGRLAATELGESGLFDDVDLLLPIPLSRSRRWKRGYNQAALIARGISELTGIPVRTDILCRQVDNVSQTRVEFWQRYVNARNIFAWHRRANKEELRGKHVMLVDDVMTTGTTMLSAMQVLEEVPELRLSVFVWSWTHVNPNRMLGSVLQSVAASVDTQEDEQQQSEAPE